MQKALWTPERYALLQRTAKRMGVRVYEPSTMPHLSDEDLKRIVAEQRQSASLQREQE